MKSRGSSRCSAGPRRGWS